MIWVVCFDLIRRIKKTLIQGHTLMPQLQKYRLAMLNKKNIFLFLAIAILFFALNFLTFSVGRTSSEIIVSYENQEKISTPIVELDKPFEIFYHGLNDLSDQVLVLDSAAFRIDVFVEQSTSLGFFRYLPIYKPVSFESNVSYTWNWPIDLGDTFSQQGEAGKFDISGNYSFLGSFSKSTAEHAIDKLISKSIRTKVETDIKERLSTN